MTPPFDPQPITLENSIVRLEPLGENHLDDLTAAACDPDIWRYLPVHPPETRRDIQAIHAQAQQRLFEHAEIPFAIIHPATGRAIGSTRYLDIQRRNRGLEIGWTWIATPHQRTAINTACKFLLLQHAFESLGAIRVCLKTDSRNERSQRAIERLGAVREGVLRNHYVMPDGFIRNSVYYSIIDSEWPTVRARLLGFLDSAG